MSGGDVWTIGHWTCPEHAFIGLLQLRDIELLVDVRSAPGSRTSPHFDREAMPWRCHRLLISNTLAARGWAVHHIMGERGPREHKLGQWGANPVLGEGGRVTYPAEPE